MEHAFQGLDMSPKHGKKYFIHTDWTSFKYDTKDFGSSYWGVDDLRIIWIIF